MYSESDLLMLSALQHLAFCERQCCLIHIEQAWSENRLTAEGRILHERVHEQETESRGDVIIVRGLKLRSLQLGLSGVADVVEFHKVEEGAGIRIPGKKGFWRVYPVEYKRGKPKKDGSDEIQLCGQAFCLEEMTGAKIETGALYYGSQHKRHEVAFSKELRIKTEVVSKRLHELIEAAVTPKAIYEKKCGNCSLIDVCMPEAGKKRSVEEYFEEVLISPPSPLASPLNPLSTCGEGSDEQQRILDGTNNQTCS